MYSSHFKHTVRRLMEHTVAPALHRVGLTPNLVTLIGFLLTVGVAVVLGQGHLLAGGILLIVAGVFDLFDGALARATQQASAFGAFFDSIIDRYSEAVIFFGLLVHFQLQNGPDSLRLIVLVYAGLLGSLMVSYSRARAEGLDIPCETGWLGRPERITILCTGLILGWLEPALWGLAVFTNITAVQRIAHVWRASRMPAEVHSGGTPVVRKSIWSFWTPLDK